MHLGTNLAPLLRLDATVNLAGAAALAALAPALTGPLGLRATWPLYATAALLLMNGVELLLAARSPRPGLVAALALVDLVFAAALLGVALAGSGVEPWTRWTLVAVAVVTVAVGALKLAGRRTGATA